MARTEAQKRANARWDEEHMTLIAAKVRREFAEELKSKAAEEGINVNALILKWAREYLEDGYTDSGGEDDIP